MGASNNVTRYSYTIFERGREKGCVVETVEK